MGRNSLGHYFWNISATIKVTRPDGKIFTWNSTRTRTLVNGAINSWSPTDEYNVTGSANGVDVNGLSFTAQITNPLDWIMDCYWIRSGTVNITPSGKPTRIIDFGSGTCDNKITVTINGITYNVTLP